MSDRLHHWPMRLELDPTAFIAPGAAVVGEVRLGLRSSVWFNTVIRGDTAAVVVGEESNIQDNSTVHVDEGRPASIGARVTVGHRAIVHGCVIEDECLVGMGAVVLSGARVGTGSLVGAGSLVREGQEIPPGSLVIGSPARVAGATSEAHREAIRRGAEHYVALARSYMERGFSGRHLDAARGAVCTSFDRGPLSFLEWGQLLEVLDRSPRWVAEVLKPGEEERWRVAPEPGRSSALEALCRLRDAEREDYLPWIERMRAEEPRQVTDLESADRKSSRGSREQSAFDALETWTGDRRRLLALLAPLEPQDWARVGYDSARGPLVLGAMVRSWVEHDLSKRRDMAVALGEPA